LEALLAAWNRDGGRNAATLVSRVRLAGSFTAWKAGETLLPVAHPAGKAWSFRGNLRLREARSQYCFVIELSLPDKPAAVVEVRAHDPRAAAFDEDEFGGRVSVLLVDRPPGAVVDPSAGNAEARAFFGEMITLFDKSAQALDAAGSGREAAAAWRAHVAAFRLLEAQGHRLEARFGPLEDLPDSAGLSDLAESLEAALHRFTVLLEAALEKYAGDADFQQAVRELAEEAPCGIP
jgi:hypothetical protein